MIVGTAMVKGSIEARGLMNTFGVFDVVATRKLYEFSRLAERVKTGGLTAQNGNLVGTTIGF